MKENLNNCMNCVYLLNIQNTYINDLIGCNNSTCINQNIQNTYINDLIGCNNSTCINQNSPYYNELINDNYSCRLFMDSDKYFKMKDRKDKLDNLNNKL